MKPRNPGALIRQPEFRYSCTAMAAALGSQAAMRRLLSWAVIAERGLEVVDAMKFTAATTEDEAYIAVARRRFPDVARLGVNALAPLSLLFVSTSASPGEERLGAGYLDPAAHADVLVDAAAALANIGDARATPALLVFLHDHALDVTGARLERIVLAVLDALGRVGDPLAVPVLEEWRARTGAVGTSAERALASVRQRHSTR